MTNDIPFANYNVILYLKFIRRYLIVYCSYYHQTVDMFDLQCSHLIFRAHRVRI